MAKYLLLKHYRGAPAPVNDVPMEQWTPSPPETHAGSSGTAATARWTNRYDECSRGFSDVRIRGVLGSCTVASNRSSFRPRTSLSEMEDYGG